MEVLLNLDIQAFRFINEQLSNPFLDQLMPVLNSKGLAYCGVFLGGLLLIWRGGSRGLVATILLLLAVGITDGLIVGAIKDTVNRPRPFFTLEHVNRLVGASLNESMPSSHAANLFAATMVAFIYYRRSIFFMLPLACVVALSRVYCGVHYPSDVLVGAILGAGTAAAVIFSLNEVWQWAGARYFPLWFTRIPSLVVPDLRPFGSDTVDELESLANPPTGLRKDLSPLHASPERQWVYLGVVVTVLLLLARWAYIASGTIELSEDEAYQWVWSKHLDLSYYSKPPLIAYTQFIGTFIWGDTAFGVRFFSPALSAAMSLLLLRFFAQEVNARAGFFLLLIVNTMPLMAAGSVFMTIDPLSVLFWVAAMLTGWRAVQPNGSTQDWLWTGLWMGLGFLSKYTQLFQLLCWATFFWLWAPAQKHLRRPGPYLALMINAVCAVPVLVWNARHDWITVQHLAERGGTGKPWGLSSLRFLPEFLGSEIALLNPVFFVAMVCAAIAFWRRGRHNPRMLFFFSMGAPLFLVYLLLSFHSRVLPNWIAPAVIPLAGLMVMFWDSRWRLGQAPTIKPWLIAGILFGGILTIVGHNTDLVGKLTGLKLPTQFDPLGRVRKWSQTARIVGNERDKFLLEDKPVFIITDHYGMTGQLSFYLPEAKAEVTSVPLVYYKTSPYPRNQFFFWSGYTNRIGQNAIYVREVDPQRKMGKAPPEIILNQFENLTDLGVRNVMYRGQVLRSLQMYACRGLR